MQSPGKRIAFLALFTALGMILSYVEALIPVFFGVPGMKPGFCNILIVFLLYAYGGKEALSVNILRIILTGMLFGNPYSIAYSLAGGVVSFAVMSLLKRTGIYSLYGVSMAGGVSHNIAQIMVAVFLVENYRIILYLPPLLIGGCITGFIIAFLSSVLLIRLKGIYND